uniref:A-kinase anchor protein 2 C-terminal domain-containing protein n=1 Tax=Sander lucioperca TaxID=283035 RepID=A0A8D0AQN7_SANLU
MATKPVAWQEQGPVNPLDEWVNDFLVHGEVGATISHSHHNSSQLRDKKAPRAEPEEDIDALDPGARDQTLQENQTLSITETVDATKSENQESTRISLCIPRETQDMVTDLEQVAQLSEALQAQEQSEKSSDSGVSADFSPCSTLEGNTISTGTPAAVPKETPIEREIRRAIEREHSLRRSRGLPNPPTSPEYVDIPLRKTVLCQPINAQSERCQGKDRQFAGKKMQHEIHEEAQREQDLVNLGKVPGFYDKGTVRQVKERKQLFEAFQKPNDSTLTLSARSKATSWSSASDISTLENEDDMSSQASTIGGSYEERIPTQSPNLGGIFTSLTPRGPGFSEGTACQVIILENNLSVPAQKLYHVKPEAEPFTVVDLSPNISSSRTEGHGGIKVREQEKEEEEEEVTPKENPFFKLRTSTNVVKVEQDIREAQEREKELHRQRISLYGGTEGAKGGGGGGERPVSTEGKSPTLSSSSLSGLSVPDLPGSSSRGGTRPTAG